MPYTDKQYNPGDEVILVIYIQGEHAASLAKADLPWGYWMMHFSVTTHDRFYEAPNKPADLYKTDVPIGTCRIRLPGKDKLVPKALEAINAEIEKIRRETSFKIAGLDQLRNDLLMLPAPEAK